MALIIRRAEVAGTVVDVRIEDGTVAELGPGLAAGVGDDVVEARGGALLPGLHDHHLHLLALTAAGASLRCGPPEVTTAGELAAALGDAARRAGPEGWVRGVGYHESVAGLPDRDALDRLSGPVPVRIQHRGGALWMLNSAALARTGLEDDRAAPVERDASGRATGRLWRGDDLLRDRLGSDPPDLSVVGSRLAATGVTGVTDATPTTDPATVALLAAARSEGSLPQRLRVMGPADLRVDHPGLQLGEVKVLLDDDRLPALDALVEQVVDAHAGERAVAVHCVTPVQLALALAVFDRAGTHRDRIEHAGVVAPAAAGELARLGLRVVTQPGFVAERGDAYRRDVEPGDLPDLYPLARLRRAGVAVAGSTDAPFTAADPWAAMRAAVERRDRTGQVLGPQHRVDPRAALDLFLAPLEDVAAPARRVAPGAPADLVLLAVPLDDALTRFDRGDVALTFIGGAVVHDGR